MDLAPRRIGKGQRSCRVEIETGFGVRVDFYGPGLRVVRARGRDADAQRLDDRRGIRIDRRKWPIGRVEYAVYGSGDDSSFLCDSYVTSADS